MGPELYRQRIKDTTESDLCTASDEAFALLLLENSYARWENIYDNNGGIPPQRRGDIKRTFDSDIEAKYTRGGIRLSSDKESQKRKGWTPEGIKRFNVLFARVKRDRTKRPQFNKKLIKQLREGQQQRVGSNKRKHETVVAAHSLWENAPVEEARESDDSDGGGGTI